MNILFGDVLLLNGTGRWAKPNKLYQSKRRKSQANYSHVALYLGPNIVVHAMPKKGVHIVTFESLLSTFDSDWLVIRNKKLATKASDALIGAQGAMGATYHLGKKYDLRTLLSEKRSDDSVVCSNFVAACLDAHDIQLGKPIHDTLPIDFQHCLDTDEWIDVTSEHKEFYKYCRNDNHLAEQQIDQYYLIWDNAKLLHDAYEQVRKYDEKHRALDQAIGYTPIKLKKPKLGFWDTDTDKEK